MAFTTDSLTEIFPNATLSTNTLQIPSGDITSFVPTGLGAGVIEMAFGLVATISNAIATGNYTNAKTTDSRIVTTSSSGTNEMTRIFNLTFVLDYPTTSVDDVLTVKSG